MANTTFPIHKLFRVYETLDQFDAEANHQENKICFIKDKRIIYANGVEYTNEQMYNDNITDNIKDAAKFKTVYNALLDELGNRNYMKIKPVPTIPAIYWTGDSNTINISGTDYTAQADKVNIDGVEYYQLKLDKDLDNDFYQFSNNTFNNLIFKDVDTSNVTNMNYMFGSCSSITSLDLSGLDTSKVTDMSNMFRNCNALTSLDVSGWNTSNVTSMNEMFYYCSALTSLDLSGWDTSNVTNMSRMFYSCSALKTIRMVGCSQTTIDKIKSRLSTDSITGCTIVTE